MRILIVFTNDFGQRFADHLEKVAPSSWQIISYSYSGSLPAVIDDPLECLPPDMPKCDLFLYVGRDRKLAELIPDMAEACKVKEVLAPVDARFFLPTGLANQIKRQLSKSGIPVAFPAPFCSLTGVTSEGRLIQEFARHFGKPQLKVNISNGRIEEVILRREAACGNTRYVAERLPGVKIEESEEKAGMLFHAHPCMASMDMDREIGDTLLHKAGYLVKDVLKEEM